jgi:hypothetical protein
MLVDLTCRECHAEFLRDVRWRICPVSEWSVFPPNDPPPPDSESAVWGDPMKCLHIEAISQEKLEWILDEYVRCVREGGPLCNPCLEKAQIRGQRETEERAKERIKNSTDPREVFFYKALLRGGKQKRRAKQS